MTHRRKDSMNKAAAKKRQKKEEGFIYYEGRDFGSWRQLYHYLPFPKVQFDTFMKKVQKGIDPREACATGRVDREKKKVQVKERKQHAYVDITLSPEEAKVYDNEYRYAISKLEVWCDEEGHDTNLDKRLAGLKKEYNVFTEYNKR